MGALGAGAGSSVLGSLGAGAAGGGAAGLGSTLGVAAPAIGGGAAAGGMQASDLFGMGLNAAQMLNQQQGQQPPPPQPMSRPAAANTGGDGGYQESLPSKTAAESLPPYSFSFSMGPEEDRMRRLQALGVY